METVIEVNEFFERQWQIIQNNLPLAIIFLSLIVMIIALGLDLRNHQLRNQWSRRRKEDESFGAKARRK